MQPMSGRYESLAPLPPIKFSTRPCAFHFDTTSAESLAGISLPESCPRNGDLPTSPLTHWQHRCHRLAQSYLKVDSASRCGVWPQAQIIINYWMPLGVWVMETFLQRSS
jgi:hypothetical protein